MSSQSIIRSYLVLTGIYTLAASIIWGINTLFLLDSGLTILQVFIVNSIFTAAMALFEIPTGVMADTKGRRASFLLSLFVLVVGTTGYVYAGFLNENLGWFIITSIILGLGYTFYSGAMEAWLVDALKSSDYKGTLDRIFSRSSMVSGLAMLIGSVFGGVLGDYDLAFPYYLRIGLLATVFIIAWFKMFDLGFSAREVALKDLPSEMMSIARTSINFGWKTASVRLLILASFVQSIFMAWGYFAWQPYFLELLGKNLTWVAGVIAALISIATIAGNALVEWSSRYCSRRTTLFSISVIIQAIAILGVGLTSNFYVAVGLYLIAMMMLGLWGPVKQAYMHDTIPSEQRATVISFDSLISSSGSVIGQNGLGQVAQLRNLASGYMLGGVINILALPIILLLRKRNDHVDFIT
ncbi:MAG: MFS transporter, partial [Calditrichaeota bacterium]|nr:MFS transporter [Calditrichota bacterium]